MIPFVTSGQADNLSVELGTSISNLVGEIDSELSKYRPGFAVGLGSERQIGKSAHLKIGTFYQQKGQNYQGEATYEDGSGTYDNNFILNYLSSSIQFKWYLKNKKVAFSSGLYGAFLINSKFNIDQTTIHGNRTTVAVIKDGDAHDYFKSHDAGIVVATSYHPAKWFYFDVKSSWGGLNINDVTNNNLRNHCFEILLGVKLY